MNPATRWLIREAYQSGEPAAEIALRYDLPPADVNRALKDLLKADRPAPEKPVVFRVVVIDYDAELRQALIEKLRTCPLYQDWRRKVLRMDRYRCRECGNKGQLQVDHIYPLSAIIHNYRIDSIEAAADCDLIWQVDNGRTLCPTCHRRTNTHGAKAQRYWVQPDRELD